MKARQYARFLGVAAALSISVARADDARPHWVSAWGSAQMVPAGGDALPDASWRDTSLRQVVRLSLPARVLRVRISNVFGTTPLLLKTAGVGLAARAGTPDLLAGSARPLRFNGEAGVMVPAGAEYLSDPVDLSAGAGADLAVSMHFLVEPTHQTQHPGSPSAGSDYYRPTPADEADRQDLNAWIRASSTFDAVADFGDALHPGADGQRAMAEAVPLDALRGCKWKSP